MRTYVCARTSLSKRSMRLVSFPVAALIALYALFALSAPAWAAEEARLGGMAATGDPLFYPCSACHAPGGVAERRNLPNNFTGHQITLHGHAALGEGRRACSACHDGPGRNPGMLRLADGSLVEITGDVSRVCFQCHASLYREFREGLHGGGREKCSSAGCHNPHTPGFIFADGLMPFMGTGFQFQVLSETATFTPMAGPPVRPGYFTPDWLEVVALIGFAMAGALAVVLVRGGWKR